MKSKTQVLTIEGTKYVLVKESEYRKLRSVSGGKRRTPKGRAVETVDAMEFASRSIARRILALREKAGMTQLELARKAGVRPETVSRIERGEANPTTRTIQKLLKAMGEKYGS